MIKTILLFSTVLVNCRLSEHGHTVSYEGSGSEVVLENHMFSHYRLVTDPQIKRTRRK